MLTSRHARWEWLHCHPLSMAQPCRGCGCTCLLLFSIGVPQAVQEQACMEAPGEMGCTWAPSQCIPGMMPQKVLTICRQAHRALPLLRLGLPGPVVILLAAEVPQSRDLGRGAHAKAGDLARALGAHLQRSVPASGLVGPFQATSRLHGPRHPAAAYMRRVMLGDDALPASHPEMFFNPAGKQERYVAIAPGTCAMFHAWN